MKQLDFIFSSEHRSIPRPMPNHGQHDSSESSMLFCSSFRSANASMIIPGTNSSSEKKCLVVIVHAAARMQPEMIAAMIRMITLMAWMQPFKDRMGERCAA